MMLVRSICGIELRLRCAESLVRQGEAVLDTFEHLYLSASSLRVGAQIRFGWSLLHVLEDVGGLILAEPDFDCWPEERWRANLDITLKVATEQARLLERLGLSGQDACFDQFLYIARGARAEEYIFLKRGATTLEADSGWALGSLQDPEALEGELEAIPIAELVGSHGYLMQVLALPIGSIAIFRKGALTEILDSSGNRLP